MKINKKGQFIPKKLKNNLNIRNAGSEKVRSRELSKNGGFFGPKWYPNTNRKNKHSR